MHGIGQHHHFTEKHKHSFFRRLGERTRNFFHREEAAAKRNLDRTILWIGSLGPLMAVPQILNVIKHESTGGLSMVSEIAFVIIATFWVFYGAFHRERPIVLVNIGWVMVHLVLISGMVLYG